ncbi:MAG: hypothetical protein ACJ77B_07805 [Chloroflexota bacterium]
MRRALRAIAAVAVTLLSACSAASPGSSNLPVVSGTTAGSVFGPRITYAEQTAAAAEMTATFDAGGTVRATAADGTTFELALPHGAVLDDTVIRMTPLADVKAAGDGPVHAVKLEPEGLRFFAPGRLTITPSSAIPVENQVMFQATGAGEEVAAALVDARSEPIVLLVEHFSVAGVAYAKSQAAWLINHARERLNALSHDVATTLQAERVRQLRGGVDPDPAVWDNVKATFDLAERDVISYLHQASTLTCAATQDYIHGLLALEREREVIGLASDATHAATDAEAVKAIDASFKVCEKESIQECREKKDPAVLVKFWVNWDRQRALRGYEDPVAAVGDFEARARRLCGSDYKIDKTVTATELNVTFEIRYTATKCGGPEGDWVIDSTGSLRGYGGTAAIGGPVTVEIAEGTLSGPVEGVANFSAEDGRETTGQFRGTATFVEGAQDSEGSRLDLKITSGSGSGYSYGFLDTGLTKPGTLTLPVTQGDFC